MKYNNKLPNKNSPETFASPSIISRFLISDNFISVCRTINKNNRCIKLSQYRSKKGRIKYTSNGVQCSSNYMVLSNNWD